MIGIGCKFGSNWLAGCVDPTGRNVGCYRMWLNKSHHLSSHTNFHQNPSGTFWANYGAMTFSTNCRWLSNNTVMAAVSFPWCKFVLLFYTSRVKYELQHMKFSALYTYHILLNKRACLNKCSRLLTLTSYISKTTEPIAFKFSALNVEVPQGSHIHFHWNQVRLRVRFLPPCPVHLFGEIRYDQCLNTWKQYKTLRKPNPQIAPMTILRKKQIVAFLTQ